MPNIYKNWDSQLVLKKYSKVRSWKQRFGSEIYFLEKIMKSKMNILDIGCATGDLYQSLKNKYKKIAYTGVDVSANLIKKAKQISPKATFIHSNIFDKQALAKKNQFDLVMATGVFQHEPHYQKLLTAMIDYARKENGYVLFDLKLFHSLPTLSDIKKSYCDRPNPIYFIVLNLNEIMRFIISQPGISAIECYGYYSGIHPVVRLPKSVNEKVCSAHILLKCSEKKDQGQSKITLHLPDQFIKKYFKN